VLTARMANGEIIALNKPRNTQELIALKESRLFYCSGCHQKVILKIGTKRRPHFAHMRGGECAAYSESESEYHLEGKYQLFEWLTKQNVEVELEKYIPELKQIPDLLVNNDTQNKIAIEYQCSTISEKLFLSRTSGYLENQITPYWLIGANRIKQVSSYVYQFKDMDWMASRQFINDLSQLFIFTFDPLNKKFILYSNLLPLTKTKVFAFHSIFLTHTVQLNNMIQQDSKEKSSPLLKIWKRNKVNWRLHMFKQTSPSIQFLKVHYYKQNLHFSLFPPEAGIPTRYIHFIQTPTYVWQAWILESIKNRGIHRMFTFKEILQEFRKMVSRNIFQLRTLPLIKNSHFSFAIMDYLNALAIIGLVKKKSSTLFVIVKEVRYPKNIEEAFNKDEEILLKLKDFLYFGKNSM
jgi:competence protein CoiA